MKYLDEVGITDYYNQLQFGKKDKFMREVADAIGKSSQSVRRKIKDGCWTKLELPIIYKIIENFD